MRALWLRAVGMTAMMVFALAIVVIVAGCGGAEARKASFLERGDRYLAEQNYEKARVEYRNAAQIDPTDARGHFGIARVAEKLGDVKDAVAQYQATVDLDPKQSLARAALARLFLMGGLPDKALELAETGLSTSPAQPQLLTVRAAVRSYKKDFEGALADAEAAHAAAPDDEYAIAVLASLYKQRNQVDRAMTLIRDSLEKLPKNIDLRAVYADLAMNQSQPEIVEEQLKKIVELQPGELVHRFRLARFYASVKNPDAAEAVLRDAVGAKPEDATAKMALIEFLTSLRDPAAAEKQLQTFIAQNPKDHNFNLQLGAFHEQREQFDLAERNYREVIAAAGGKPDGLAARNRLAAMLLKRNDTSSAATLIAEVLKENSRDNDALIMRGNMALARGDTAAAITDLRSVLRDQPNSVPLLRGLARAHQQNGDLALAEEALRSAVQVNVRDPDTRLDLGRLLLQLGKVDQALPLFQTVVKDYPNNPGAQEALVRAYVSSKQFAAARASVNEFRKSHPDLPIAHYLAGVIEESDGKVDAAVVAYEAALQMQPKAAEPLTALVRLDLSRKNVTSALARIDKTLSIDENHAIARNLRGELLTTQGKYTEASTAFDAAIATAPQWWAPYRGLAIVHAASKNYDAAEATLRRGIEHTNGASPLYGELTSLYGGLGKSDAAIESYEQWLQREPKSVVAANNLAMLLVNVRGDKKSLERARQLATQLVESDEPAVLDTRGWVDYKSGNYGQAIQLLSRALEKSAASPVYRYHLAMAQLASGDAQTARKNLEGALGGGNKFPGAAEAQEALARIKSPG